jgi:hypothetical protein
MAGLLLITLSQEYVKADTPDASNFQIIGTLLKEARFWGYRCHDCGAHHFLRSEWVV